MLPLTAATAEQPAFSVGGTCYIPSEEEPDAVTRGIATSRRASALAVWVGLRAHGWETVREAVRRNIELTRLLEETLAKRGFTVLPGGRMSLACARWEPDGWDADKIDRLQTAIARDAVASGSSWFATVTFDGKVWLRFNMVNLYTHEHHVRALAEQLVETARRLSV